MYTVHYFAVMLLMQSTRILKDDNILLVLDHTLPRLYIHQVREHVDSQNTQDHGTVLQANLEYEYKKH